MQHIASEIGLFDFHQDTQRPFSHYLHMLQSRGYTYATAWLPHDAEAKSLGTGRSVEEIARSGGWRIRIVLKLSVADGINAVRTQFPVMWFDKERCSDGVQALRQYRYDVDPDTGQFSRNPLHDDASNGSDALRYGGGNAGIASGDLQTARARPAADLLARPQHWLDGHVMRS